MSEDFQREVASVHHRLVNRFEEYRDQIAQVLFFGERISRSDLQEGINEVVRDLEAHVDAIQRIVLPALSGDETSLSAVDMLATFQNQMLEQVDATKENIELFADPDQPKEKRNRAARNALKDVFRLDGLIRPYFRLVEQHFIARSNGRLDEDEREELISTLKSSVH